MCTFNEDHVSAWWITKNVKYNSIHNELKRHCNTSTNKQNTYDNKENNINNNNFVNYKCQVTSFVPNNKDNSIWKITRQCLKKKSISSPL